MTSSVSHRRLVSERDHLLAELDEIDHQFARGEIDRAQRDILTEAVTAEAARVIVALERGKAPGSRKARGLGRVTVALVAVGAMVAITWFLLGQLAPREPLSVASPESSLEERAARLADVLADDPSNVPARLAYARFLIQMDQLTEAVAQFDEVVVHDPTNTEALTYGGWVAVLTGTPGGIDRLDRAVATDPGYPDARALRGLALVRAGRESEARADLSEYLRLVPDGPLAAEVSRVISGLEPEP